MIYDAALFWLDSVFCLLAAPIRLNLPHPYASLEEMERG